MPTGNNLGDGAGRVTSRIEQGEIDHLKREAEDWKHLYSDVLHDLTRAKIALAQAVADLRTVGDDYPGSSCHKWCYERADKAAEALNKRIASGGAR